VGGGIRPVKYLVKKIVLLLKEYLCSCDVQEATRCLKDLEVPHFHHELVYEAVVMVTKSMHKKTDEAMCKLLQALFRSFVITIKQLRAGFQRVYDQMVDISIDVPQAYSVLERWVLRCRQAGIINDDIVKKMPSRGRKRFVSEGDGGLIKDISCRIFAFEVASCSYQLLQRLCELGTVGYHQTLNVLWKLQLYIRGSPESSFSLIDVCCHYLMLVSRNLGQILP
jgi:hypothetical protein